MPAFIAALLGGLVNIAGTIAGRVLIALGISVVTYSGLATSLDYLKTSAVSALTGLPSELVAILALMKVGSCISIMMSAVTVRMTLNGLTGDTMRKWVK